MDSLTGKISGSSAGYRHAMLLVGLMVGGRSPTGERPTNSGKIYAAVWSAPLGPDTVRRKFGLFASVLILEGYGAEIAQWRMQLSFIVDRSIKCGRSPATSLNVS